MRNYLYLLITICCLTAFVSCQDEDYGYSTEDIRYKSEFVKEFGKPDPNHNWGFKPMEVIDHTNGDTRAASPNANQWGSWGLDVPYPLTQVQKDFVTNWFATTKNPVGIAVSWTDYFAQQVSSTAYGEHMDQILDAGPSGDDHIYNYNNGDAGKNVNVTNPNVRGDYADKIQYMTGQSTEHFAYHETLSDNEWYNHYVIIPGEMIDPTNSLAAQTTKLTDLDGKPLKDKSGKDITITQSIWGMWFVAFDYEASHTNPSQTVARDYYYNDWIIKISPGTYSSVAERVMCEDLGNSFDWDFNDVVFDVNFSTEWDDKNRENVTKAHITVQCAGGTMPIKVGTTDDNMEIHKLFHVDVNKAVVRPKAPVQYTIEVKREWWFLSFISSIFGGGSPDASMIPIYVDGNDLGTEAVTLRRSGVPQKFSCPTSVDWQDELKCITLKYSRFPTWAKDQNTKNVWNLHPEHDFDE